MKVSFLVAACTMLTINVFAQDCDPEEIFGNTTSNAVCDEWSENGALHIIYANSLPDHETGTFPNPGNPNSIRAQRTTLTFCTYPEYADELTWLDQGSGNCPFWIFGVAMNGLEFDPIAAEFFENPNNGQINREWNENALSDNINLGLDINNAHVQPTGKYHYHGDPVKYIESLGLDPSNHSPIIGYAADGFPIYYRYVYMVDLEEPIVEATSGWRLKEGDRPGDGVTAPDGPYDGTYTADYEFHADSSNVGLDECNGKFGVTEDYPMGTYYYVITADFPVIPRCFKGRPDKSFTIGPPPAGCSTSDGASFCATLTSVTEDPSVVRSLINVYPSPTTGVVRFDVQDPELVLHLNNVSILDAQGRTLVIQPGLNDIDLSNASAGTYYVRFDFDGTSVVKPLIKQ